MKNSSIAVLRTVACFVLVLIMTQAMLISCMPDSPDTDVPTSGASKTDSDSPTESASETLPQGPFNDEIITGNDDTRLREYIDSISQGKAYFLGYNLVDENKMMYAPTLITTDGSALEPICDCSDCGKLDRPTDCDKACSYMVVLGDYAYGDYARSNSDGTKRFTRLYRFKLSENKTDRYESVYWCDIEELLLNDNEGRIHFVSNSDTNYFYTNIRSTDKIIYRVDVKNFVGDKPEVTEYRGFDRDAYDILYCDNDGNLYCAIKSQAKEDRLKDHYTGICVFSPESEEPRMLIEDIEIRYYCEIYPGLGDSMLMFCLEKDESCVKGYDLCQYTFLETDEGVKCKRTVRERDVLEFTISGDNIYLMKNTAEEPVRFTFIPEGKHPDKFHYTDYSETKLYSAPLLDGEFECIWQDDRYNIFGYSEFNSVDVEESFSSSFGSRDPSNCAAMTQVNMDGFLIRTVQITEDGLVPYYILFDVSGEKLSTRYIQGSRETGFWLSFNRSLGDMTGLSVY